MILSILATRPNVTSGQFTKEDVAEKKVNLLFFGNFHKMKLPDYEWAMQELIKDKYYVYNTLTQGPVFPRGGLAAQIQVAAMDLHDIYGGDDPFGDRLLCRPEILRAGTDY